MARNRQKFTEKLEGNDDGWIWGNQRGGGGAPLKDAYGNSVANLKGVLRGETEVDHSPSKKQSMYGDEDDGFPARPPKKHQQQPPQHNKKQNSRFEDDDDDPYAHHRNKPLRNKPPRNFEDDSDNNYPPHRDNNNNNRRNSNDGDGYGGHGNHQQQPPKRQGRDHRQDDYDHHQEDRRRNPELYDNYIPPNPHSPGKKFMSSLQTMHGNDHEKQEKMR
jgi:hypothetical protein